MVTKLLLGRVHAIWQYIVLLSLLLLLPGCGTMGASISGKVIDKSTGKPIEGAIVVARWQVDTGLVVQSQTECIHVESATSNKKGKFRIPFWIGIPKGFSQDVFITVYKQGYQRAWGQQSLSERYLEPFVGSREARLAYLFKLSLPCESKNLLNMYRAIHQEASDIAVTSSDKLKVLYLLKDMEKTTMGSDKAWENFRKRKRQLK